MKIRISGVIPESIVDGEGVRLVIFTQGCPHHCPDCHNGHTWALQGGKIMDTEDFRQWMQNPLLDGITLSGGEPFIQEEACAELADMARSMGLTVWCYTGYRFEELRLYYHHSRKKLLDYVNVLVDGRYDASKKSMALKYRGSSNQRIIDVRSSMNQREVIDYDCK